MLIPCPRVISSTMAKLRIEPATFISLVLNLEHYTITTRVTFLAAACHDTMMFSGLACFCLQTNGS